MQLSWSIAATVATSLALAVDIELVLESLLDLDPHTQKV